jgi:hypothetical protein
MVEYSTDSSEDEDEDKDEEEVTVSGGRWGGGYTGV